MGGKRVSCLVAAVFLGWLAVAGTVGAQTRRLNVICSVQIEWCELVRKRTSRPRESAWRLIHRSSIEALALLMAERKNPRTDVWFGGTGDPHLQAAEQGLTVEYRSRQFDDLQPWAQAQAKRGAFRTVGLYSGALGIAYNPEQIRRLGVEAPRCWRDLVRPEFERQVMMAIRPRPEPAT